MLFGREGALGNDTMGNFFPPVSLQRWDGMEMGVICCVSNDGRHMGGFGKSSSFSPLSKFDGEHRITNQYGLIFYPSHLFYISMNLSKSVRGGRSRKRDLAFCCPMQLLFYYRWGMQLPSQSWVITRYCVVRTQLGLKAMDTGIPGW